MGDSELVFVLTGFDEEPIQGATLEVRGEVEGVDMEPVIAEAAGGSSGVYRVPFRWDRAGDWTVTVEAALPDGTIATREFDVSVAQ